MKNSANKFFILFAFMFGNVASFAKNNLPAPNPNGKNNGPPPPPGLPIEEWVWVLFMVGVAYGIYLIYKITSKNIG